MLMNRLLLKESERLRHLRGIWWALRTIMHFLSQTTVAVSGCNCLFEPKVSLCDWNGQTHIRVDATRTVGNKKNDECAHRPIRSDSHVLDKHTRSKFDSLKLLDLF